MDKRQELLNMVSGCQEQQRFQYEPEEFLGKTPHSWEEYDKQQSEHIAECGYPKWFVVADDADICDWVNPDEAWLLTPEQAKQLGDVRDFKILLQSGYDDKLWEWGLVKKWGKAKKQR